MNLLDKFYRYPFAYLCPALIAGLVISNAIQQDFFVLILSAGLLSGLFYLVFIGRMNDSLVLPVILFSMLLFGYLLGRFNEQGIDKLPEDRGLTCLLRVQEASGTSRDWKKGIGIVEGIIDGDEIRDKDQRVLFYSRNELQPGELILVRTNWQSIVNRGNPGEFDAERYWNHKGIVQMGFIDEDDYFLVEPPNQGFISKLLNDSRNYFSQVLDQTLPENVRGIGKAILLGDKSELEAETRNSFSNAGATHVLAVSGLHVGIIMYILTYVLQSVARFISKNTSLIIVLLISWFYAALTGFSPSVVRAVLMFSLLMTASLYGRSGSSVNILFLSAFLLLLFDPDLLYDLGFELSYLAMLGIFWLYRPIRNLIYVKPFLLNKIWEGTAVGIAAQLFTVPLTLYYFHQFPNYFMLSNLAVMALAGVVLGLGIALFSVSWSAFLSKYLGLVLALLLFVMISAMQFIEMIPGSVVQGFTLSSGIVVLLYALLLFSVLWMRRPQRIKYLLAGSLLVLVFIQFSRSESLISRELVVFNANSPVIAVKNGDNIRCFHTPDERSGAMARRLLDDYVKVRPGTVTFIPMKEGKFHLTGGLDGAIKLNAESVAIQLGSLQAVIRTGIFEDRIEAAQIIDLPFMPRDEESIHLAEGAYIKRI